MVSGWSLSVVGARPKKTCKLLSPSVTFRGIGAGNRFKLPRERFVPRRKSAIRKYGRNNRIHRNMHTLGNPADGDFRSQIIQSSAHFAGMKIIPCNQRIE